MEVTSPSPSPPPPPNHHRDFLLHLESFLSRRDGVDKLLKISRYAAKLIISTTSPQTLPIMPNLKSFESSVAVSRKAFRLGKFIQDVNSLRSSLSNGPDHPFPLPLLAYAGEGIYYFLDQILWLNKIGLLNLNKSRSNLISRISAWAELIGYLGSISIKIREIERMRSEKADPVKIRMKWVSVLQDLADGLMALADVRDGRGRLTGTTLLASAGLLSAVISAKKNWDSCC